MMKKKTVTTATLKIGMMVAQPFPNLGGWGRSHVGQHQYVVLDVYPHDKRDGQFTILFLTHLGQTEVMPNVPFYYSFDLLEQS